MLLLLGWSLQDWSSVITIAVSLVTFPSLALVLYQLYLSNRQVALSNRSLQFNVYTDVMDLLEAHREDRHLLDKMNEPYALEDFERLSEHDKTRLDELARVYDRVGLLVQHRVIPVEFILDFYSRPLVIAWHRLQAHVANVRVLRSQPGHMETFRLLAFAAKRHRDKKRPREETFSVSAEEWSEWKKAWKGGDV